MMKKSAKVKLRLPYLYAILSLVFIMCLSGIAFAEDVTISIATTTIGGGNGGTVTSNYPIVGGKITVPKGSTVIVVIQANTAEYYIKEVNVDSEANQITSFPIGSFQCTFGNIQDNHWVSATFERWYAVETAKIGAGSITPYLGSEIVPEGANRSFTFIPDPGYMVNDVQVNGVSKGAITQYSLNDIRDHYRIVVSFVRESFTVETRAGEGGSISPPGITTVPYGEGIVIRVTPDPYYGISQIWVNGVGQIEQGVVTQPVDLTIDSVLRDYLVEASFERTHHVIGIITGPGGTVTPSAGEAGLIVPIGSTKSFSVDALPGFRIDELKINGVKKAEATGKRTYAFSIGPILQDYTIEVTFSLKMYNISPSVEGNGTINPSETIMVPDTGSATFTITPDACNELEDVLVDGESVMSGPPGSDQFQVNQGVGTYTFRNVESDHTIKAIFKPLKASINVKMNYGGTVGPAQDGGIFGPAEVSFQVEVSCGGSWVFQIAPIDCYKIKDVKVDGQSIGVQTSVTFSDVRKNYELEVIFEQLVYKVNVKTNGGGEVGYTQDGAFFGPGAGEFNVQVICSGEWPFEIKPDACHVVDDVTVARGGGDPVSIMDIISIDSSGKAKFNLTEIRSDHYVSISFKKRLVTVTTSLRNADGSPVPIYNPIYRIVPSGAHEVECGENLTIQVFEESLEAHCYVFDLWITAEGGETLIIPQEELEKVQPSQEDIAQGIIMPRYEHELEDVRTNYKVEVVYRRVKYLVTTIVVPGDDGAKHGTISPDGIRMPVDCQSEITFTIKPDNCHKIGDVKVTRGGGDPVSVAVDIDAQTGEAQYTLSYIEEDTEIEVSFERVYFAITTIVKTADGSDQPFPSLYDVLPSKPLVKCGESSRLDIREAVSTNDCYDFELRITPEVGDPVVMKKSDMTFMRQFDAWDRVYKYTYDLENIQSNILVELIYSKLGPFSVTASAGANGKIEPSGKTEVECGGSITLKITPDHCYEIQDVKVSRDGGDPVSVRYTDVEMDPMTNAGTYSISDIRGNYTVDATFAFMGPFIVTCRVDGEGGAISPETAEVVCGKSLEITITPDHCYAIDDVKLTRGVGDPVSVKASVVIDTTTGVGKYTLADIATNCRVDASFRKIGPFDVTASVSGDKFGTISPESKTVECGEDLEITIEPQDCCEIDDLTVARGGGDPVSVKDDATPIVNTDGSVIKYFYILRDIQSNCSVVVTFRKLGPFTVTASAGTNGKIEPSGKTEVECGGSITLKIIPDHCYEIDDVKVSRDGGDPVSVRNTDVDIDPTTYAGTYSISNIRGNYTVEATFAFTGPFIVTCRVDGEGGTISPETAEVQCGKNQEIIITPDHCYGIDDVKVTRGVGDPVSVKASVVIDPITNVGKYTLADIATNCRVDASFRKIGPFDVTASVSGDKHGTISPESKKVECGEDVEITIEPENGYEIDDLTVARSGGDPVSVKNDVTPVKNSDGKYSYVLRDIQSNCSVVATFRKLGPFTVTATAGANGKIEPSGKTEVEYGGSLTLKIIPDHCYEIDDVKVSRDGGDPVSVRNTDVDIDPMTYAGTYTISNIQGNYTVEATFAFTGPFIVTCRVDGEGGTISPETAEVQCGKNLEITITPEHCYVIDDVKVTSGVGDPVSVKGALIIDPATGVGKYTLTDITTNCRADATFKKLGPFTVDAAVNSDTYRLPHGKMSPEGKMQVECGEDRTFTLTPDPCCWIESVWVAREPGEMQEVTGDVDIDQETGIGTYKLGDITSNCTVRVNFKEIFVTVTVKGAEHGHVYITDWTPYWEPGRWPFNLDLMDPDAPKEIEGSEWLECGENSMIWIRPDAYYQISNVKIAEWNGPMKSVMGNVTIDAGSGIGIYELRDVKCNYTMEVTFSRRGDMDGDQKTNSRDALTVLRIAAGQIKPTEEQKKAADVNGDGEVNAEDAMIILQEAVEQHTQGQNVVGDGNRRINIMLADLHGTAGENVTLPVVVDNADLLACGDISITYDSSVLRAVNVLSNTGALMVGNVAEPGTVRIAFASDSGLSGRTLAKVEFSILADDVSPLKLSRANLYRHDSLALDAETTHGKFESWSIPPERSELLQNFPNPFNPETWIPYQLEKDSDVIIRIYSVTGELVKELDLGHRSAGVYVNQNRAAYWNGTNEAGENVASGVYFYTLHAGIYTAVRKMVVAY